MMPFLFLINGLKKQIRRNTKGLRIRSILSEIWFSKLYLELIKNGFTIEMVAL
jgi:hypothetical protein